MAITPPPICVKIDRFEAPVRAGSKVIFRLMLGPFGVTWDGEIAEYQPQRYFRDVMRRGPFGAWSHTHTFSTEAAGTRVIDRVEYEPPMGLIGRLIDPFVVRPALAFMFKYRAKKTRELLEQGRRALRQSAAYR